MILTYAHFGSRTKPTSGQTPPPAKTHPLAKTPFRPKPPSSKKPPPAKIPLQQKPPSGQKPLPAKAPLWPKPLSSNPPPRPKTTADKNSPPGERVRLHVVITKN